LNVNAFTRILSVGMKRIGLHQLNNGNTMLFHKVNIISDLISTM